MKTETKERDFEYWAMLAKSDPERFEKERKEAIEEALQKIPESRRENARRFQQTISGIISLYPNNPLATCSHLLSMVSGPNVSMTTKLLDAVHKLHCLVIDANNTILPSKAEFVSIHKQKSKQKRQKRK